MFKAHAKDMNEFLNLVVTIGQGVDKKGICSEIGQQSTFQHSIIRLQKEMKGFPWTTGVVQSIEGHVKFANRGCGCCLTKVTDSFCSN